ncbi:MAG: hypothetical protein RMX98_030480 [Nostoc sp. DedQUE02]
MQSLQFDLEILNAETQLDEIGKDKQELPNHSFQNEQNFRQ